MRRKLAALIQWFIDLDVKEHDHWCSVMEADGRSHNYCRHRNIAWKCTGIFCASQRRKDCPECDARHSLQERVGMALAPFV